MRAVIFMKPQSLVLRGVFHRVAALFHHLGDEGGYDCEAGLQERRGDRTADLGTTIGPLIGGWLIFQYFAKTGAHGVDSVKVTYLAFCIVNPIT
jgi:hypothetical protein